MLKKYLINTFRYGIALVGITLVLIIACNIWVVRSTRSRVYFSLEKVPSRSVALVLGTSKYSQSGKPNLFFRSRIQAAIHLYVLKKISHFIASGDNSRSYYNEPLDMKKALISSGIPTERVTMDFAGFSTFDSVVRSKKVFGQDSILVITQNFHCYRALFISDFYGMHAIAFGTGGVPSGHSPWTRVREYLARFKAVIDLYILKKKPKFLGEPIIIQRID